VAPELMMVEDRERQRFPAYAAGGPC
jgi:hypothetical protein